MCHAAVKKTCTSQSIFCEDEDYILPYLDQKPVLNVLWSDKVFSVAKYKQELQNPTLR